MLWWETQSVNTLLKAANEADSSMAYIRGMKYEGTQPTPFA